MTTNKSVLAWIDEMKELVTPDKVVWIDGSEEQLAAIRAEGVATGEMIKLNEELLPGCYLHRTKPNDVARVEARTFICIGWSLPRLIRCSLISQEALIRAVQCTLSLIPWVRSVRRLRRSASR